MGFGRKKFKKGEKIVIKQSKTPGTVGRDEENGVVQILVNGSPVYLLVSEIKRK